MRERRRRADACHFTTDLADAVAEADAVFIAVGTPSRRGDGHADLRYVEAAAIEIAKALTRLHASSSPRAPCRWELGVAVAQIIRETNPDADFDVASNPEFLREGSAIGDFMRPDRVVIGAETERARDGDAGAVSAALPASRRRWS